jgi:hypothetical protein
LSWRVAVSQRRGDSFFWVARNASAARRVEGINTHFQVRCVDTKKGSHNMNIRTGGMIAVAVASLFTGFAGCGSDDDVENKQQAFKCEGGNTCKAMSECKSAGANECQGMNACTGMGYITTKDAAECEAKKAAIKASQTPA